METIRLIACDVETTHTAEDQAAVAQPQPIALEDLEFVAGAATRAPGNGW
ncbi:MAG TPA: hypothetical protein VFR90_10265 [Methylibium sp.]|nr:hypothetical protein [Methylibium sp.]HEU4459495.1 hypothetical protein [Methylibium sp.]